MKWCDDGAERISTEVTRICLTADSDCRKDVSLSVLFGVNRLMNYADDDDLQK